MMISEHISYNSLILFQLPDSHCWLALQADDGTADDHGDCVKVTALSDDDSVGDDDPMYDREKFLSLPPLIHVMIKPSFSFLTLPLEVMRAVPIFVARACSHCPRAS